MPYTIPLYHSYVKSGSRDKKLESISVLILGGGRIGKEFFKATYCCGQMLSSTEILDDYKPNNELILPYANVILKITVMSEDAEEAEKILDLRCRQMLRKMIRYRKEPKSSNNFF